MINVTKPFLPDIREYESYLQSIYKNNWLTNNGPLEQELTSRLSDYLGVKNLILVANGTLALTLAYRLLGIKKHAITTPFSYVATTSSLVWDNIKPEFADIASKTFTIDVPQIEKVLASSIGADIEAIVPVHVFGNGCDIDNIKKIADREKIKVVYDASHTFSVKYKNSSILNCGDISTLSFHATKLFHTIEGGALIINDDELFARAKQMINFGYDSSGDISDIGLNAKLSEFHAAMGLAVLNHIDDIIESRKIIVEHYYKLLGDSFKYPEYNKNCTLNYSYFPILFKDESSLIQCIEHLNNNGVFPKRYFYPSLNTLPYIESQDEMFVSSDISNRIMCLPLYPDLKLKEVDFIVKLIKEA